MRYRLLPQKMRYRLLPKESVIFSYLKNNNSIRISLKLVEKFLTSILTFL